MTTGASSSIDDDCTVILPISSLSPADSPRVMGEDADHVQGLAEVVSGLPPILVHRQTMRIVDGMHRVRAAIQRGQDVIAARFFDGTEIEAFVLSVKENSAHGLPLSLADRKAATERIVALHPEWSDRSIATVVGLAPTTVGAIRRRCTDGNGHVASRIGRDGRVRPIDGADRRRRVSELIAARPNASLRQIARAANVSVGTAHAVRKSMFATGGNPAGPSRDVPERDRLRATSVARGPARNTRAETEHIVWSLLRQQLRSDPSLRYTESGRKLLRWLDSRAISAEDWPAVAELIPAHWKNSVAHLAYRFSKEWHDFAKALERSGDQVAT
jgi:ParB-like chromosome segregation protein Spo0J